MGKITAHLKNILGVTTIYTGNIYLCHKINIPNGKERDKATNEGTHQTDE